ncbi:extracellular solute-binding protein [Paenibacillus chartarius]|uniref:Extracellular solute-binding protein n=1 Tax=Paenibacillus chartarius TaxID=747481 RepID=A0ABV6DST3_9BACL
MAAILLKRTCVRISMCIILLATVGCREGGAGQDTPVRSEAGEQIRITLWTPLSGGDGIFMHELVTAYNKENKDGVTVDVVNNKSEEYYTKLPTAIVTEEAPDVAIIHASRYAQYIRNGFIDAIDDYAPGGGVRWEDLNPHVLSGTMMKGKHYSIPLDTHFTVLFYNKKLLRAAGLLDEADRPIIEPGPDGFMHFLETIRKRLPNDVAPLSVPSLRLDPYWLWWSFYNQMDGGGAMYANDGRSSAINNPAALKAMNYVYSLYKSGLIPPNVSDSQKLFVEGQAATLIQGVWGTGGIELTPGLEFGAMELPQLFDRPASWGDSHTFAFPRKEQIDVRKRMASVKFAYWVAQHGDLWAKAGHVPASYTALSSDAYQSLRFRPGYAAAAEHVRYFPSQPMQGEINDWMVKEFMRMLAGQLSPEELLRHAETMINEKVRP